MDCGRAGVSEAETAKDDGVCGPRPGHSAPTGMWARSPLCLSGAPNLSHFGGEAGKKGVEELEGD